ncbi:MAG: DUF3990 domain-containing protein [Oscillospiraceae bacterium]|nr:DUF3990 domain-containing protein [Oscillospiraceae bacterium]
MSPLKLYHASAAVVKKPQWDYAREILKDDFAELRDFGLGFYTCADKEYPLKIAAFHNETVYLNEYEIDIANLNVVELKLDIEWLISIAFHRREFAGRKKYTEIKERCRAWLRGFDIVIGTISNDRTFSAIEGFLDNTLSDTTSISMVDASKYGVQYTLKSDKACERLKWLNSYKLTADEVSKYKKIFENEKREYSGRAEEIKIALYKKHEGDLLATIIGEGLFNGRVRF